MALREAREESGMARFDCQLDESGLALLDVDVHGIPARPGEPAHRHFDLRFLLVAGRGQPLLISDESTDLRWFPRERTKEIAGEESLLRLSRKARLRLALRNF